MALGTHTTEYKGGDAALRPAPFQTKAAILLLLLAITGFFFWNAGDGLRAGLTYDDLMNMQRASKQSPTELLRDNLLFFRFTEVFRPFGAIFYKLHYVSFGLDPFPLRVVLYVFLTANIFLTYIFVALLTRSREAGLLSAFLMAYHPSYAWIYYSSGYCYDIFCYFFYLSAFAWYIRARQRGRYLTIFELLVFLGLFLCALNSKEMAVTLPVAVGIYELLFHPPAALSAGTAALWLRRNGLAAAIAGLMTAGFVFGRVLSPEGLGNIGGYRTEYSVKVYLEHVEHYLSYLFQGPHWRAGRLGAPAAAILAAMAAAALISRSRRLAFCLLFFCVGILPVAFIPQRGLESVYIPILGVVTFLVMIAVRCREFLTARLASLISGRDGDGVRWGMQFRRAGQIMLAGLAIFLATKLQTERKPLDDWKPEYNIVDSMIAQQREARATISPNSRIIYLRESLPPPWDWWHVFIADLVYGDKAVSVSRLSRLDPAPSAAEIAASYDYVFTMDGDRLTEVERNEAAIEAAISSMRQAAD